MGATGYHTKQKDLVLRYLTQSGGAHVTVDALYDRMRADGCSIGKTTVYRRLEDLARRGDVRKYAFDSDRGVCYQFVGQNVACGEHFHLKCVRCGRLIHVDCDLLEKIDGHVREAHAFAIDRSKTVFYGVCADCGGVTES